MRQLVFFLTVLLALWIAGASFWYVCKVRCVTASHGTEEIRLPAETEVQTPKQILMDFIEVAKTFLAGSGVQKGFFAPHPPQVT